MTQHVHGSGALLQQTGSVRRSALEASAAALAGGVALDEAGVMDAKVGGRERVYRVRQSVQRRRHGSTVLLTCASPSP